MLRFTSHSGELLIASDLINKRLCFGLGVDVGAEFDQTLGHGGVLVLAGFFQHAVVQLRVTPHLVQRQAHRLAELTADRREERVQRCLTALE